MLQLDRFHSSLEAGDLASLVTAQDEIERKVVEVDTAGGEVGAALSLPAWGDQLGLLLATGQGLVRPDSQGRLGGWNWQDGHVTRVQLYSGDAAGECEDLLPAEVLGGHLPVKVEESCGLPCYDTNTRHSTLDTRHSTLDTRHLNLTLQLQHAEKQ